MRSTLALAAALAATIGLSGCGNNDQADNTQNVDENLTAENIVSNDVTAIDAVTGADANMAADIEYNELEADAPQNNAAAAPRSKAAPRPATSTPRPRPASNSASDAAPANTSE
ncbi:MAG TPA: hypothetical protein VM308_06180 [Sphingomicrobium sp.]|nr:hypothetical protein [Sphingomicrobium sp.]